MTVQGPPLTPPQERLIRESVYHRGKILVRSPRRGGGLVLRHLVAKDLVVWDTRIGGYVLTPYGESVKIALDTDQRDQQ